MASTTSSTTQSTNGNSKQPLAPTKQRWSWTPRVWVGGNFSGWLRLLAKHNFAVSPRIAPIAMADSLSCLNNSALGMLQQLIYGRAIAETKISQPPVFILGHWRSGTTLLHELLALDENNTCPSSYQCFLPNHFLLTHKIFPKLFWFMMPAKRPMDNMDMAWDRPQEDEFALCNLGVSSPYLSIAFPNRPREYEEFRDLENAPPAEVERWKERWVTFLKTIAYQKPGRLVLKSPLHTCRVPTIQELFPEARFVYLVRDPQKTFSSTVHLWKTLHKTHGLQVPKQSDRELEEYVARTGAAMFDRLEQTKPLVEENRWLEIRYEDLVADPVGNMQRFYEQFGLEGFDTTRVKVEQYFADRSDYRTNKHQLSDDQQQLVEEYWGPYFERFGYDVTSKSGSTKDVSA